MFSASWRAMALVVALVSCGSASAQQPVDGRGHPMNDPLLDRLIGDWVVTRTMDDLTLLNTVHVEWVLDHQFVSVHYRDTASPSRYEAMVFIGYDQAGHHYVVHWMDVFGGRYSETLGTGEQTKDRIVLQFPYPDGLFENTFVLEADRAWTSRMRQRDDAGTWTDFATDRFQRAEGPK